MNRILLCFTTVIFHIAPQQAKASIHDLTYHKLLCGGSTFALRTASYDRYPLTQTLDVRRHNGTRHRVDLDEHSFMLHRKYPDLRILSAVISAWICRKTPVGPVLEVLFSCPMDYPDNQPDGDCSLTNEWNRYITPPGMLLDRGYAPDDPRYRDIERRLAIPANESEQMISTD